MKLLKHTVLIIYKAKAAVLCLIRECLHQMTKKMGFLDKDKNSTETELICDMISSIPNPA